MLPKASKDGKDCYNDSTQEIQYTRLHRKIVRSWKMYIEVLPDDEVDFMHLFRKETLPAHDLISEDKFLAQHSSIMLEGLTAKGIASIVTLSLSVMIFTNYFSSTVSLSSSIFCFLIFSCSSSVLALFELLLITSASSFLKLSSTNSVL
nr:hypothetical protein [Tanacetum cinerariifolium]